MQRPVKYYVSTRDGAFNGGCKRLTVYCTDRAEAEKHYNNALPHYNTLFLKMLFPDNKTRKVLQYKIA
jgi:hypothetical protein